MPLFLAKPLAIIFLISVFVLVSYYSKKSKLPNQNKLIIFSAFLLSLQFILYLLF